MKRKPRQFFSADHGHFNMAAHQDYFAGKLEDYEYPEEAIKASIAKLPNYDWPPKA